MDELTEAKDAFLLAMDRVIEAKDAFQRTMDRIIDAKDAFYDERNTFFAAEARCQKPEPGLESGEGAFQGTARGRFGSMDGFDDGVC